MPARDKFIEECKSILESSWNTITESAQPAIPSLSPTLYEVIKKCINSKTKTYRYVLPTQLLAKVNDSSLDCRSIQVASGTQGAFDARSLCHKVIVPFDKSNENVLGGSTEPYVSNPLRVPRITKEYREQQKDKEGWDNLCLVLDEVENKNYPSFTKSIFEQTLVEIYNRLSQVQVRYPIPTRIDLTSTINLITQFTSIPSGGEHPLAVLFAMFKSIGERFKLYDEVRRLKVTASDASSGRIADIECLVSGIVVLAIEVKDKVLTIEQVKAKVDEARSRQVSELLFLAEQGVSIEEELQSLINHEFTIGQNIYELDLVRFLPSILILFGEAGRGEFLINIGKTLDEYSDIKSRRKWAELLSSL